MITILQGDCIEQMKTMPEKSVQCVVTSPPYWGLRDYGTATWEGGSLECDHKKVSAGTAALQKSTLGGGQSSNGHQQEGFIGNCKKCGAVRIDKQIGLEPTPREFVAKMVAVFAEVWRVLKDDGVIWVNLGDSYARDAAKGGSGPNGKHDVIPGYGSAREKLDQIDAFHGLKPKDLVGIPWRVAFALQQPREIVAIKDPCDRAWMAAMIDGEGCITSNEIRGSVESGRAQNESYPIILQVRMADRECLHRIVEITGMSKVQDEALSPSMQAGNQRPASVWKISGENAATILAEIYPYLLIKRKQAVAAWNLQRLKDGIVHKRGVCIPEENMEMRRELHRVIRALNQRQHADIPSWCEIPSFTVLPGWYLRSDVIWHKPNPMPESVTDRPTKAHEYIFLLTKNERYFYDADAIKEPVNGGAHARTPGNKGHKHTAAYEDGDERHRTKAGLVDYAAKVRAKNNTSFNDAMAVMPDVRNKRSVWTVPSAPYKEAHFATYPPDLIKPCILAGSRPGDMILDPFGGSGCTGMVANELGRDCTLIELNPAYVKLIERRTDTTPGLGL